MKRTFITSAKELRDPSFWGQFLANALLVIGIALIMFSIANVISWSSSTNGGMLHLGPLAMFLAVVGIGAPIAVLKWNTRIVFYKVELDKEMFAIHQLNRSMNFLLSDLELIDYYHDYKMKIIHSRLSSKDENFHLFLHEQDPLNLAIRTHIDHKIENVKERTTRSAQEYLILSNQDIVSYGRQNDNFYDYQFSIRSNNTLTNYRKTADLIVPLTTYREVK